ncbi:hypothetical protein E2I00_018418, partial [Balaenoptera physalus]
ENLPPSKTYKKHLLLENKLLTFLQVDHKIPVVAGPWTEEKLRRKGAQDAEVLGKAKQILKVGYTEGAEVGDVAIPGGRAGQASTSSMASPKKKLQGLVAATITPMTEHGEINFSVIGRYVDYLVEEQGVKNIFVNGTTGEGLSLSISERCRVAEEWVTEGRNKLDQIVIHVGALSLKESQELAQHAAKIGADGIAVIAPFFLKPWNKDVLINFLKEVAAAAPALPFYYYHIPALTGVKIRAEELLDGIQDKIPTFQGLKFSDTDLLDFGQCVDQNRQQQFAFLFGVDEQLLSALVMGATGAVGSTYNYLGKKTNQMLEAFERKDFSSALNHQFCIQRFINFVVKLGFGVSQTKAIMTLVSGIPMGPPRLPLQKASREFTDNAEAKLKSLDFLSFTDLKDGNLEACS